MWHGLGERRVRPYRRNVGHERERDDQTDQRTTVACLVRGPPGSRQRVAPDDPDTEGENDEDEGKDLLTQASVDQARHGNRGDRGGCGAHEGDSNDAEEPVTSPS